MLCLRSPRKLEIGEEGQMVDGVRLVCETWMLMEIFRVDVTFCYPYDILKYGMAAWIGQSIWGSGEAGK
jgi:hypothetical protein